MATILGAGAVGLALGARLGRAGHTVRFLTRRAAAARLLEAEGVSAEDPASGDSWRTEVTASDGWQPDPGDTLLLCVRAPDVAALEPRLARAGAVVCFQNGVDTEPHLARTVPVVIGAVWRQTCTRVSDNRVRFTGTPRVVLGRHPSGRDPRVDELGAVLRGAGFDVGSSDRIGEDKWLKLCVNLMSAPNALVRREDHEDAAFVEIKVRLLAEARQILAAAGIAARSCDGRDRSLDEEIRFQRESLVRRSSARRLPIYNQVWASLRHGAPCEAVGYHRRLIGLADRHGLPARTNRQVLRHLETAVRQGSGPESVSAAELLGE